MRQEINLYNSELEKKQWAFSASAILQGSMVVLIGVVLSIIFGSYQLGELQKQVQSTALLLQTERDKLSKLANDPEFQRKNKQFQETLTKMEVGLAGRQEVLTYLKNGSLGTPRGFSEYMRAFARQSTHGLWLIGFSITEENNKVEILGRSLSPELVPSYIKRLNREQAIRGRAFTSLRMTVPEDANKQPARYVEFDLTSETREAPHKITENLALNNANTVTANQKK